MFKYNTGKKNILKLSQNMYQMILLTLAGLLNAAVLCLAGGSGARVSSTGGAGAASLLHAGGTGGPYTPSCPCYRLSRARYAQKTMHVD